MRTGVRKIICKRWIPPLFGGSHFLFLAETVSTQFVNCCLNTGLFQFSLFSFDLNKRMLILLLLNQLLPHFVALKNLTTLPSMVLNWKNFKKQKNKTKQENNPQSKNSKHYYKASNSHMAFHQQLPCQVSTEFNQQQVS